MLLSRHGILATFCWWSTLLWLPSLHSFSYNSIRVRRPPIVSGFSTLSSLPITNAEDDEWILSHGLLLSSFTDGLRNNVAAQEALRHGLVRTLLLEAIRQVESIVQQSATFSPCCGPTNVAAWSCLEQLDEAVSKVDEVIDDPLKVFWNCFTEKENASLLRNYPIVLRVAYIPTAMYALRPESHNTPGKQRQRARADAKQRRDELFQLLQQLLTHPQHSSIPVQICTVDWDDGSVKQPQQSPYCCAVDIATIPAQGKQVFGEWSPHLIYVQGGNTFWLHHCMTKGHWDTDLLQLCQRTNAFYIGASAGAILAGRWMQTACWKEWDDPRVVPGMEEYGAWESVAGLQMMGEYSVFVHYDEEQWVTRVEEKSRAMEGGRRHLITLRDDQAVYVNGRQLEVRILSSLETFVEKKIASNL
ncbi:hypothetical protein FisN_30Lh067 [Fistulifera solaris]|uniref:Uncharacterized protein n=1 Tax=Fistulifera solaris TaxID=1519565 RepID=A0A1Z5JIL6_FISSO|nr:hypothetical protein FisN_30Lh067 [Fistulifera solaris]|eukprot:GAX13776.1 hypothetical protein FisN_30Lh067 [Fistulifera solaris]